MGEKGKETIEKTIRSGRVRAICTSERRGTEKHAVSEARFEKGYGIRGDAHAGNWHRQVSLLSYDKVKEFNERGAKVVDGAFGENLVVEDLDFRSFPVGTILECEDVVLKMTQIGKECHTHCQIYQRDGRVHYAGAGRLRRGTGFRYHPCGQRDDGPVSGWHGAIYSGGDYHE